MERDSGRQQQANHSLGRGLGGLRSSKIMAHTVVSFTQPGKTFKTESNGITDHMVPHVKTSGLFHGAHSFLKCNHANCP